MVEILALVLLHDEQLVERAVCQALEIGGTSKQHVLNCLSRLQEPERPQRMQAPAKLKLVTEPVADIARYDALRRPRHES